MFFLTARHREALLHEEGIESWHFEQHVGEAVFIPAGCPHQARVPDCPSHATALLGQSGEHEHSAMPYHRTMPWSSDASTETHAS